MVLHKTRKQCGCTPEDTDRVISLIQILGNEDKIEEDVKNLRILRKGGWGVAELNVNWFIVVSAGTVEGCKNKET